MFKFILTIAILAAALNTVGCASGGHQTGILFERQKGPGGALDYAVYVPRGYTPERTGGWPCILFLHGSGESGSDGVKQVIQGIGSAIQWNQSAWPCIVIFPQKPDEHQQWERYDAQVMAMLEATRRRYHIDPKRIYLTGLSQGGHGTWTFAANHPGRWAALAPICGYPEPMSPAEIAAGIGDEVPVWAFHGLADDVVDPKRTAEIIDALRARRAGKAGAGEVRASMFEGVNHGAWDRAYRDEHLAEWLLAQRRE